jgi:iron complex outermembrane receptor protein
MVTPSLLLFLCLPAPTVLPESADSTARVYPVDEIVVTATRSEALRSTVASAATVLDSVRVALTPGTLLATALSTVPGLSLREYGGNAAVRTVSVRGFGAENVLVMVDGERVNSYQNGGVDFGLVPLALVEKVEVLRGGQSGLYGADAVGGIITIQTRRPSRGLSAGLESTVGGFGFSAIEARAGAGGDLGSLRIMGRRERGSGNYGFTFDDGSTTQELLRTGADFRTDRFDGRAEIRPADDLRVDLRGSWLDADRGSPGPVTDPTSTGRARLYDQLATGQGSVEWRMNGEWMGIARASFRYGDQRYVDPGTLLAGQPLDSRSISRTLAFQPQVRWTPSARTLVSLDGELNRGWMDGSETHDALRRQAGLALSGQQAIGFAGEVPWELVIYPSVRYDWISDVGQDVSAKVGANLAILREPLLRLRGSYGKNFRAPTFNELYWIAGGNPDLRPERSISTDAGMTMMVDLAGDLSLDVSAFWIDSRDRIVWVPATGTYWSPQNIGEVTSNGLEVEARWRGFTGMVELVVNSTWLTAKKVSSDYPGDPTAEKILVYTPRQTASVEALLHLDPLDLSAQNVWTSYRFTTPSNDEFLPAYSVTSAALRGRLPVAGASVYLKLEVLNLFDADYSSIALYPMPGREVRGTLGVEL